MKTAPDLKNILLTIAAESIRYNNDTNKDEYNKYVRRLYRIFKCRLSDDERIFILQFLLNNLYYKNVLLDEDNMIKMSNVRVRTVFSIFIVVLLFLLSVNFIFNINPSIGGYTKEFFNLFKLIVID